MLLLSGNVVNVCADLSKSVMQLPRTLDQVGTVHVEFKRRMVYTRVGCFLVTHCTFVH
jgi:hypothetical protein